MKQCCLFFVMLIATLQAYGQNIDYQKRDGNKLWFDSLKVAPLENQLTMIKERLLKDTLLVTYSNTIIRQEADKSTKIDSIKEKRKGIQVFVNIRSGNFVYRYDCASNSDNIKLFCDYLSPDKILSIKISPNKNNDLDFLFSNAAFGEIEVEFCKVKYAKYFLEHYKK